MMNYQIVMLGSPFLENDIKKSIVDYDSIGVVDAEHVNNDLPVLYLYFGKTIYDKANHSNVNLGKQSRRNCILPILKDAKMFNSCIPEELKEINGFVLTDKTISKLKNYILTWFGIMEQTRKVFISYKRSDTQKLARELHIQLSKKGYIPFLDECSIQPGAMFQDHLRNEIADSDVMIVLSSKNYLLSGFTKEELKVASRIGVGMLQVVVDDGNIIPDLALSMKMKVTQSMDSLITVCQDIIVKMEESIAKCLRLKKQSLIDGFRNKFRGQNVKTSESGALILNTKAFVPVTHVPTSYDLYRANNLIEQSSAKQNSLSRFVLFNGLYCRNDILDHLKWLNKGSLPISSFDIK